MESNQKQERIKRLYSQENDKKENEEIAAAVVDIPEVDDILRKLAPEEKKVIATAFRGPLPPPEILKGYVDIYPEAAEKIFRWVEEQQTHRHQIEKEHMNKSLNIVFRG